ALPILRKSAASARAWGSRDAAKKPIRGLGCPGRSGPAGAGASAANVSGIAAAAAPAMNEATLLHPPERIPFRRIIPCVLLDLLWIGTWQGNTGQGVSGGLSRTRVAPQLPASSPAGRKEATAGSRERTE